MLRYTGGRNLSGYQFLTDADGNSQERETVSCAHCQYIMTIQPGSGTKRGYCFRCNAVICGKQACMEKCVPFEKAIEDMESRDRLYRFIEEEQAERRYRHERGV